ncbi:MAG: hypothetical protein FWE84_01345 [Firmicutes bacterium]|nr:hypothetical protein [Bacillota bacterium]
MRIGVFFGGRSCEHDISIITGVMTVNAAKAAGHKVTPVYIDGAGQWYTGRGFDSVAVFLEKGYKKKKIHLCPADRGVYTKRGRRLATLDAVINCCHGRGGEDGCLAGLLELSGVPCANGGVLAGAVGMDKTVQKRLFEHEELNVTPFIGINKHELEDGFFDAVAAVKEKLTFPLMVKPARGGSSIGIGRAHDFKEFFLRLDEAFMWDDKVIVENALTDFIEVNCAVLGSGYNVVVSEVEQPVSSGFLSFENKYGGVGSGEWKLGSGEWGVGSGEWGVESGELRLELEKVKNTQSNLTTTPNSKLQTPNSTLTPHSPLPTPHSCSKGDTGRYLPARISPEMSRDVRAAAKKAFELIGCAGVARVDFLIKDGELFINEINTVPGSLSSYLFAFDGMGFPLLVDKLLEIAVREYEKKQKLTFAYDSGVLRAHCRGERGVKKG